MANDLIDKKKEEEKEKQKEIREKEEATCLAYTSVWTSAGHLRVGPGDHVRDREILL